MCAVRRGSSRRTSIVVVRPSGHPSLSRPKPEVWTSPPLLVPATCLLAGAGLPTVEPVHMIGEQFAFSTIVASGSSIASSGSIPEWNGATRRLYFEGVLVKEFRQPAENQEIVLAAFEAKGWEVRVDDPLPPDAGPDVRDRLKNTVKGLNRQKCPLLWFSRDGLGRGICWQRR